MSPTAAELRKLADYLTWTRMPANITREEMLLAAEGLRRWAADIGRAEYEAAHRGRQDAANYEEMGMNDSSAMDSAALRKLLKEARQYVSDAGTDEDPETQQKSAQLLGGIGAALKPDEMPSKIQRDMMRHALGLNRSKDSHRNYYSADVGDAETCATWDALVACGFATKRDPTRGFPDVMYQVTDAGRKALEGE